MSDTDVHWTAIASGDAHAFGQWMAVAEPEIRVSLRRFATVVDTEAVLQECLLRIWQVAPRHEPDGKPNSLLRLGVRIARNLAISDLRKDKRAARLEESSYEHQLDLLASESGTPNPIDPFLRKWIELCRDKLPVKPASVLRARLTSAGASSDRELAAALRMKTNTFLQNFTRARKMLVECLKEHGVDVEMEMS